MDLSDTLTMKPDYFVKDEEGDWDGLIYMRSIKNKLDWLELTETVPCGNGKIPIGYEWNGASVGPVRYLNIWAFPKWKHPIATVRHDWRCQHAKTKEQRKIADKMFKADIALGQTNKLVSWWEQTKGYLGVRIGALLHGKNGKKVS